MRAKDIMTPNVVTVTPDAMVDEIAELLLENKISAVPVVNDSGGLEGIVSEGDLIRRISGDAGDRRSWWLKLMASDVDRADDFIKSRGRTAREVMTTNVVSIDEDTELSDIAATLESHAIKRVPVVKDGKLTGIVSRSNLLQVVAGRKTEVTAAPTPGDREIRTLVHDSLVKKGFVSHGALNVIVDKGVVELWGWVESDSERQAMLLAAGEIAGVKEVRDHFGKMAPWIGGT